jgi:AraC-like DNA-binding protein/ligand-binding sensor protein
MQHEMENAIHCFEQQTSLPVVVHDLQHRLWSALPLTRFRHGQPVCTAVKDGPHGHRCTQFEIDEFRTQSANWVHGRVHRCHAGLVELALPVFERERLLLVLFAGPAQLSDHSLLDWDEKTRETQLGNLRSWHLPRITAQILPVYQELLRQLAARLRCWINDSMHRDQNSQSLPRRQRIEQFIELHHAQPIQLEDLAHDLHLSPERCRHVVKQTCEMQFSQLLRSARIRSACALLLNTEHDIATVARQCGLPDPSGFHRAFQQSVGMSPSRWRRMHRA